MIRRRRFVLGEESETLGMSSYMCIGIGLGVGLGSILMLIVKIYPMPASEYWGPTLPGIVMILGMGSGLLLGALNKSKNSSRAEPQNPDH